MNKEDILQYINDALEEEHGAPIGCEDTLISSGVDSFGLTMVLVNIDHKYNIYPKEVFSTLNFAEVTADDVIERVLNGDK